MFKIGNVKDFRIFPTPIILDESEYFLIQEGDQYFLLSNICPHMGGDINLKQDCFECPVHGWKFNFSGRSTNVKDKNIERIPVIRKAEELWVDLILLAKNNPVFETNRKSNEAIEFLLHSHASIEIRHKDFSLLCDPWLIGPAFMGAWLQYPPFPGKIENIRPSAIWISHEHSDHLHENTLKYFDRSTPIYFPSFPNQRINKILKNLGFVNVHPMAFGETCKINDAIALTTYEPESIWNDAILLVNINDFNILNLNDAGINNRIARLVPPIDVLLCGYSITASSYPMTWRHLTLEQKDAYYEKSKVGAKLMLEKAAKVYRAKFLMPFASHFTLWHPQHQSYRKILPVHTLMDVTKNFKNEDVQIVDLLPGESWKSNTGRFYRNYSDSKRQALYKPEIIQKYINSIYSQDLFDQFYPQGCTVDEKQIRDYFLRLNNVPEIIFCENLSVNLSILDSYQGKEMAPLDFHITDGRLSFTGPQQKETLQMIVPQQVLGHLIRDDISWDEASIGYWCEFNRNPDVFHAAFWRLLQTPYYKKTINFPKIENLLPISGNTNIAQLLEKSPGIENVLRRYGLYCGSCGKEYKETIAQGAQFHGLSDASTSLLIREINSNLSP